jgi:hypothetical protein
MAQRPVFVPSFDAKALVHKVMVEFTWHPGMSPAQKRKSITSLHQAAASEPHNLFPVLEVSTKSSENLGLRLSAFNLMLEFSGRKISVENAFQGSKVFEKGLQYIDLYNVTPREAKTDPRLKSSGKLIGFRYEERDWPLMPPTAFYDWLYLNALMQSPGLSSQLMDYHGFTDIEFNPNKSINCQAYSAALFVSLSKRSIIKNALSSAETFMKVVKRHSDSMNQPVQLSCF